jgi:hypothetical protein
MTTSTQPPVQPVIEQMPPLPPPSAYQGLKLLPFEYRWFHIRENAERLGYTVEAVFYSDESVRAYAREYGSQLIASKEAEAKEAALKYVSLFGELQNAMEQSGRLLETLIEVKRVLAKTNEMPRGPIVDTIWYSPHETLFDYIDSNLNQNQGEPK